MRALTNKTNSTSNAVMDKIRKEFRDLNDNPDVRTVNLVDLFDNGSAKNSDGKEVGFNPYKVGTDDWLDYAMENGVWVQGVSVEQVLLAEPNLKGDDLKNVVNGLKAMAEFLQTFQDEMVRLAASGATPQQLKDFAASALSTGNSTPEHSDVRAGTDPENAKHMPGIFYHLMLHTKTNEFHEFFNDFSTKDVDRPDSARAGIEAVSWTERFKEAKEAAGIESSDTSGNQDEVASDAMRLQHRLSAEIAQLPPELQKEAYALMDAEFSAAVNAAAVDVDDRIPGTPEYERDTIRYHSNTRKNRDKVSERQRAFEAYYA